jgi:hypothetical protein
MQNKAWCWNCLGVAMEHQSWNTEIRRRGDIWHLEKGELMNICQHPRAGQGRRPHSFISQWIIQWYPVSLPGCDSEAHPWFCSFLGPYHLMLWLYKGGNQDSAVTKMCTEVIWVDLPSIKRPPLQKPGSTYHVGFSHIMISWHSSFLLVQSAY